MPKDNQTINRSLFDLLDSKGYEPTMLDTSGKAVPIPEEAEVFQFDFIKDGKDYGPVTITIDGLHRLIIYYGKGVADSAKEQTASGDESWYSLLRHLKRWAKNNQLSFELNYDRANKLKYDMAKRDHMKRKEKVAEGYYPMGKKASYNDNTPTVKMVIQHNREIQEGEQRYRNVARIFLENQLGERILAPTIKPGIASIYARHLAEGGLPHDERWNHINSLCEEYTKMAGFVRATRNGQFNESAQQLVNQGVNHYQSLRESLSKMRGHRGYNSYFESYTPPLMEDDSEETNLNELFVQETLDPRIESVMPILNKLHKKVAEMKEVGELAEWADNLTEAPGAETLTHDNKNEEDNLDDLDLAESDTQSSNPGAIPEEDLDEGILDTVKKVGSKVFDKLGGGSEEDLIRKLQKSAGLPQTGKKPEPKDKPVDEARMFGYDIQRVPSLTIPYDDSQELKKLLGQLVDLQMKAEMSPEARRMVSAVRAQMTTILQRNGLKESDLMNMEEVTAHQADQKINTPAVQRKEKGGDWKVTTQDLAKADEKNMTSPAGMSALKKRMNTIEEEEVEESALQAYLGDKKYGKDGMDALRKAGRDNASKEKMQNIRAKYSSKEEVAEDGEFAGDYATGEAGQWRNKGPKAHKPATIGDLVGENFINTDVQAVVSEKIDSDGSDDLARILNIAGIKR